MADRQIEELRGRSETMQSQMETSLSQSHENMEKIFAENRKLEHQKHQFVERNEKLRLAQQKIQELEKDLSDKKELLSASEKTKLKLLLEKNEIEEKTIDLEDKLKKTTARYQAINNQCDETIAENQVLQTKLNSHNNSFVSMGGGDANR